ncbi:MAG: DUF2339 domain-containing protein [Spirochaetia bacterium]|nr:DUF2339 domain-containing protein [Spirochaetia bacterium]
MISRLRARIEFLERFVGEMNRQKKEEPAPPPKESGSFEETASSPVLEKKPAAEISVPSQPAAFAGSHENKIVKKDEPIRRDVPEQISGQKKKEVSIFSHKAKRIEKIFVENWTGILGSIILTMGIAFFGITAGLVLSPFSRFILINLFSVLLYAIFIFLRKKTNMGLLALWMRSTAGAVFLFSCLGSGGIPGLQWIENPFLALLLLIAGVSVNLLLGFISSRQMLATFHVVVSLVAVAFAPANFISVMLGGGIVFFGIILSYKEKWDFHLLLTILSFFAFHLFWNHSAGAPKMGTDPAAWASGLLMNSVVGISAILIHYREIYAKDKFEILPFVTHLVNWIAAGIGYILYSSGSKWNPFVLMAAALLIFLLTRKAKKINMKWLLRTDVLVAESLVFLGILFLHRWELSLMVISFLLLLELFIFAAVMLYEKDEALIKVSMGFVAIMNVAFMITSIYSLSINEKDEVSIYTLAAVFLNAVFPILLRKKNILNFDSEEWGNLRITATGIYVSLLSIIFYISIQDHAWATLAVSVLFAVVLMARRRFLSDASGVEFLLMAAGILIISWILMVLHLDADGTVESFPATLFERIQFSAPIFIMPLFSFIMGWKKESGSVQKILFPGIYLFAAHTLAATYYIFNSVSPLLAGILYLLYSAVFLEISRLIFSRWKNSLCDNGNADVHLIASGAAMLAAFFFRHVLVHLQAEYYTGFIKIRFLIEIAAIAVLIYWIVFSMSARKSESGFLKNLFLYMTEMLLIFLSFTAVLELPEKYLSLYWSAMSVLLFLISGIKHSDFARFRLYSIFLHITASFYIAFVSGSYVTPSGYFLNQAWLGGLAALIFQFAYLYLYLKSNLQSEKPIFPSGLGILSEFSLYIDQKRNLYINYPVFIAVALFLYWSFDHAILTLLWTLEVLLIFILSIILRVKHFRHISMGSLLILVGRLIFYDMDRVEAIYKIFVFIGVGVILIFMNYLYNKYKDRY